MGESPLAPNNLHGGGCSGLLSAVTWIRNGILLCWSYKTLQEIICYRADTPDAVRWFSVCVLLFPPFYCAISPPFLGSVSSDSTRIESSQLGLFEPTNVDPADVRPNSGAWSITDMVSLVDSGTISQGIPRHDCKLLESRVQSSGLLYPPWGLTCNLGPGSTWSIKRCRSESLSLRFIVGWVKTWVGTWLNHMGFHFA